MLGALVDVADGFVTTGSFVTAPFADEPYPLVQRLAVAEGINVGRDIPRGSSAITNQRRLVSQSEAQ